MQNVNVRISIAFTLFLLFFPTFGLAIPDGKIEFVDQIVDSSANNSTPTPTASPTPVVQPLSGTLPSDSIPTAEQAPYTCRLTTLSSEEASNLLQLRKDGQTFKEVNSDDGAANKNREEITNDSVIIPDADGKTALKEKLPNTKLFGADDVAFLNNISSQGGFSYGIILDETLRVGRCKGDVPCYTSSPNTSIHFDGAGISSTVKNVWTDISGAQKPEGVDQDTLDYLTEQAVKDKSSEQVLTGQSSTSNPPNSTTSGTSSNPSLPSSSNTSTPTSPPAKEPQSVKELTDQVKPEVNGTQVQHIGGKELDNVVTADSFEARMQSPATNPAFRISMYSLFDKYYNSWFSAEMTFTSFGPTLVGKAGRVFRKTTGKVVWPWKDSYVAFKDKTTSAFASPLALGGKQYAQRYEKRNRNKGFGEILYGFFTGEQKVLEAGGSQVYVDSMFVKGGKLFESGISKDPELRKEFVNQVDDIYRYSKISAISEQVAQRDYKLAIAEADRLADQAAKALALQNAQIDYGKKIASIMSDYDAASGAHLDFPKFWLSTDSRYNLKSYYVKTHDGRFIPIDFQNTPSKILKEFQENGGFVGQNFATSGRALELYLPKLSTPLPPIAKADLEAGIKLGYYPDTYVKLPDGKVLKVTNENIAAIKDSTRTATVELWKGEELTAATEPAKLLSGSMAATSIIGEDYIPNRIRQTVPDAILKLRTRLESDGWSGRWYFNFLDQQAAKEQDLVKKYVTSLAGAAEWTARPLAFWYLKRAEVGPFSLGNWSAYQLPESWSSVVFNTSEGDVYNDAFVDFFANAGSDEGDLFQAVLQKMPYTFFPSQVIQQWPAGKTALDAIFNNKGRDTVGSIGLLLIGQDKCETCHFSLPVNKGILAPRFSSDQRLDGHLFEYNPEEKDQTLISFAHHTNISGESKSASDPQAIDLVQAQRDKTTCADAVKKVPLFGYIPFGNSPQRVGFALSAAESAGYVVFGPYGILGSIAQQASLAPELNDCVDDKEGYYTHYYAPAPDESKQASSAKELGSVRVANIVEQGQNVAASVLNGFAQDKTSSTTPTAEPQGGKGVLQNSLDAIKEQTQTLAKKIEEKDIVQASLFTSGLAYGGTQGSKFFWLWMQHPGTPLKYRTQGEINLVSTDGNKVKIDLKNGTISKDGKTLVKNPDLVRLSSTDLSIPAYEVPQRVTGLTLPGTDTVMIEVSAGGEALVKDARVLDCFKQAVKAQHDYDMTSDNLQESFGKVNSVETDLDTVIPSGDSIVAEGKVRFTAQGSDSKINIRGNRVTEVVQSKNGENLKANVGNLDSIQFKNGVAVYKPETNELLIWLKHNEQALLRDKDVSGLKAKLTTVKNPNTNCSEPAIDLSAIANASSDQSQARVDAFNKSIAKQGPFQVFDTDKKTFILYADAECKPHFKIIDKVSGQIYDQAIDSITQTPTGVEIKTADGKTHALDFSTENGKPILSYNGDPQVLRVAQGPNGSFYYDPEKGLWYSENGQLLPMLESFKQQGLSAQVNPNGSVSGVPSNNIFFNSGKDAGGTGNPWNIPSLPQETILLALFIASLIGAFMFIRVSSGKIRT